MPIAAKTKPPGFYKLLQKKSMASRINRHFEVQFKLEPGASVPFRKRETDAGFDLAALEGCVIEPGQLLRVRTGVAICCPPGYWFDLRGRSSINNEGIIIPVNVIDAQYTGEISVHLFNTNKQGFIIKQGDRIAQAVFYPILHPHFVQQDEIILGADARGSKGFGSSGRNEVKH